MKPKNSVSYFPITLAEQALLLRTREPDLAARTDDLLIMLGLIAEANLTSADLEQAIQLLDASRQGEALDARFGNLEARLRERIERGLTEIEGRLSRRIGGPEAPAPIKPAATAATAAAVAAPAAPAVAASEPVPAEASLAFRVRGELVWAKTAAQFYVGVWRWLFQHGVVTAADLPIPSGKSRYAVSAEPVHPSGKEFTAKAQPVAGAWLETNLSRADIIARAKKALGERQVGFEVVVGE
jgi:hypothetical protein